MPHDALRTILPMAGWSAEQAARVSFTGEADPVLPTPFRIATAGAATLAATGLAAADLWTLRTGRQQDIAVDVRQATASLRSGHYLKVGDGALSAGRNPIMGFYPAKDGHWSYVHANFPNHRAAALQVLGCAENRDAVARAVATWDAADLEEAIIAAKGAGGMVRTHAEWADHPQAAAIAALPLMEIVRIGDSDPEPLPPGNRPLAGIRVARPHARAGRPDLCPHPGGARRRRDEDFGGPSAQPRLSGVRHWARQALSPPRPPRSWQCRHAARPGAAVRRVLARLPPRHAGQPRTVAGGTCGDQARPGLCLALRVRPYRPLGVTARLRYGDPKRQRHCCAGRPKLFPPPRRDRNSIRSPRSTTAPAT